MQAICPMFLVLQLISHYLHSFHLNSSDTLVSNFCCTCPSYIPLYHLHISSSLSSLFIPNPLHMHIFLSSDSQILIHSFCSFSLFLLSLLLSSFSRIKFSCSFCSFFLFLLSLLFSSLSFLYSFLFSSFQILL